jgi:hypothetical protein
MKVPAIWQQRLEQKAQAEGLTVEEALLRAIQAWVMEDQILELVVDEIWKTTRAKVVALLDKRELDERLAAGFRRGIAQAATAEPSKEAWRASEDGWDPNAEPWE